VWGKRCSNADCIARYTPTLLTHAHARSDCNTAQHNTWQAAT